MADVLDVDGGQPVAPGTWPWGTNWTNLSCLCRASVSALVKYNNVYSRCPLKVCNSPKISPKINGRSVIFVQYFIELYRHEFVHGQNDE